MSSFSLLSYFNCHTLSLFLSILSKAHPTPPISQLASLTSLSSISNSSIETSLMAPHGRTYKLHGFQVALTLAFLFSFVVLLPKSGGSVLSDSSRKSLGGKKVLIGSKPPACGNKCMNCRPCTATVVVSNHKRKGFMVSSHEENDSYYLLSWKCRCGDKLFQP